MHRPLFPAAGFLEICVASTALHLKDNAKMFSGVQNCSIPRAKVLDLKNDEDMLECTTRHLGGDISISSPSSSSLHMSATSSFSSKSNGCIGCDVFQDDGFVHGDIRLRGEEDGYYMHPSTIDGIFHVGAVTTMTCDVLSAKVRVPVTLDFYGIGIQAIQKTKEKAATGKAFAHRNPLPSNDVSINHVFYADTITEQTCLHNLIAKPLRDERTPITKTTEDNKDLLYESCWVCVSGVSGMTQKAIGWTIAIGDGHNDKISTQYDPKVSIESHSLALLLTSSFHTGSFDPVSIKLQTSGAYTSASPISFSRPYSEREALSASGAWGFLRSASHEMMGLDINAIDVDVHAIRGKCESDDCRLAMSGNLAYGSRYQNGTVLQTVLRPSSLLCTPLSFTIVPEPRGSLMNLHIVRQPLPVIDSHAPASFCISV